VRILLSLGTKKAEILIDLPKQRINYTIFDHKYKVENQLFKKFTFTKKLHKSEPKYFKLLIFLAYIILEQF